MTPPCSFLLGAIVLSSAACSSGPGPGPPAPENASLQLFGFVGVACEDDYSDELAGFTNVATVCAPDPAVAGPVGDQLGVFDRRGLRALLNAEGVFFKEAPTAPTAPYGGPPLELRDDYRSRWEALVAGARLVRQRATLAAVFVADEPTWRGVSPEDLAAAYAVVEATLPDVPLLLVEAHPVLARLQVPPSVDWVAFDRYGVLDPESDPAYLADLSALKGRRSRPSQRVVLVMEAQWLPEYSDSGVQPETMGGVAESYYRLARRDTSVIGVVGYLWPGGRDTPGQLGARDLPESVRAVYREIGREIVQNNAP